MQLDAIFISNINDIYGERGKAWLNALPLQIQQLCEKYQLRFVKPMPGLTYNFVGLIESTQSGETAILKIAPAGQTLAKEAKWLQCFKQGVAKVYWYDEQQHAFLMEHLVPGKALKTMVGMDDVKATRIICQVIRDLQAEQQAVLEGAFKHLSEHIKNLDVLQGKIDTKLLSKAQGLFVELTSDRRYDVLLHGDLHHDNILSSGHAWKAIDPHGYVGDPVFEVGPMIYNPGGNDFPKDKKPAQIIDQRLQILAEELPFDPKRIQAWAFCMTMLSIAWTVEDHGFVPEFELAIAHDINKA
ncbi:MAG: aminoglycoside phosphotransferase family protein [Candidatus Berkiella sp.]